MENPAYLLLNLAKNLKYQMNDALKASGLTASQWAVLQQFAFKEKQTANQLGQQLGMDKPTISGVVKRLVEKDYLTKTANPQDARSQLLSLTAIGQVQSAQAKAISEQVLATFLTPLTTPQQQELTQLLLILNGANPQ